MLTAFINEGRDCNGASYLAYFYNLPYSYEAELQPLADEALKNSEKDD